MKTTNGPATNISMAFMPNACDGPHLGHLYSLLLNRLMYINLVRWKARKEYSPPALQWKVDSYVPIQPRFYLCIDHKHCHAIDDYIKMIEWLGWDDVILFRNDLADYDSMHWWACAKMGDGQLNVKERRILFFNWAGVYVHYRGTEMSLELSQIDEPMIAKHLNMRVPTTIYHPTILNEEGTKIEGDDSYYRIRDVFDKPALNVVKWFANWLCPMHYSGHTHTKLTYVSDKDAELFARTHQLLGPRYPSPSTVNERIPRNWKDRIEYSN